MSSVGPISSSSGRHSSSPEHHTNPASETMAAAIARAALTVRGESKEKAAISISPMFNYDHEKATLVISNAAGTSDSQMKELLEKHHAVLSVCKILIIQDGSKLTNLHFLVSFPKLESFQLRNGAQLTSLDGVRHCSQLRSLDITNCVTIPNVDSLAGLSLQELIASGCSTLENIDGLKGNNHLKSLNIASCMGIRNFRLLGTLINLEELNVNFLPRCNDLVADEVLKLHHLKKFSAEGTAISPGKLAMIIKSLKD